MLPRLGSRHVAPKLAGTTVVRPVSETVTVRVRPLAMVQVGATSPSVTV